LGSRFPAGAGRERLVVRCTLAPPLRGVTARASVVFSPFARADAAAAIFGSVVHGAAPSGGERSSAMNDRKPTMIPLIPLQPSQRPQPSLPSQPLSPLPSSPQTSAPLLPHHRLLAWTAVRDLLSAVLACNLRDATLRDQALRSAKSACLNTAEGAGRVSRADKARAFAIARGEVVEAVAAVEIAGLCGEVPPRAAAEVSRRAERAVRLLTGLCR
jgi:four helix bundle protein